MRDPAAGGAELLTFCIITTDSNDVVAPIHSRMPVILHERDYYYWLASGNPEQPPIDLLRPYDAEGMTAWKVDRKVGNVKNDTASLIESKAQEPQTPDQLLFDS